MVERLLAACVLVAAALLPLPAAAQGAAGAASAPAASPAAAPAALPPAVPLDDPIEKRVMAISAELRCLVCQNQTIADSHAGLALDLREQVRQMLRAGKTDREVLAFMTERYGDFVLYRPPVRGTTMLLWFGPLLLMAVGLFVLWRVLRRRARLAPDQFDPDPDDAPDDARAR